MSPSPTAMASVPPPECSTTCSIAAPSLEANQVERRKKSSPASANVRPSTDCIRRVASISSATFSSSGTVNGSSCIGPCQLATAGSTGDSVTGSPGSRCAAFAISTARTAVRVDLRGFQARGRGEPPPAAHQHADPDPGGDRTVDAGHLLVADGERLGLVGAGASIGEIGSCGRGGLDRHLRDVQHPDPPSVMPAGAPGPPALPRSRGHRSRRNRGILPGDRAIHGPTVSMDTKTEEEVGDDDGSEDRLHERAGGRGGR